MQEKTKFKNEKSMKDKENFGVRNNAYRELFLLALKDRPEISDITLVKDGEGIFNGNLTFAIDLKNIGLSITDVYSFKKEISSDFFVSFLGELLVRENLNLFLDVLYDLDSEEYFGSCNRKHEKFGVRVEKGKYFVFTFHVSLLKNLIAENFKIKLD